MKKRPILSAIAVLNRADEFLLVRRKYEPNAGFWGFPGGKLELGETIFDCATRELKEETGLIATALDVLTHIEIIQHDLNGQVEYHYLLMAVLCEYVSGHPLAADDADATAWVSVDDIKAQSLKLTKNVELVAQLALDTELQKKMIK